MLRQDSGSAAARLSSVASEKTTPQPKVSCARLRSSTVTAWAGSAFFIRRARYRPAGPAPTMVSFIASDANFAGMKKLGKNLAIGVIAFYTIKGIAVTAFLVWFAKDCQS